MPNNTYKKKVEPNSDSILTVGPRLPHLQDTEEKAPPIWQQILNRQALFSISVQMFVNCLGSP